MWVKEVHVRFLKKKRRRQVLFDSHLIEMHPLTFHLFWVKVPLSQYRPVLLCSYIARLISHENE